MNNKIELSHEEMIEDLTTQLIECKSTYSHLISETYVEALWSVGETVAKHPAFKYGEKMDLYKTLSEKSDFSVIFLSRSIDFYQTYPFNTFEEVMTSLHKELPERIVMTERSVLELLKTKKSGFITRDKSKVETPLQTSFKNAVLISKSELMNKLENVEYIKVYFKDGTMETYKIDEEDEAKTYVNDEMKELVFTFWDKINGYDPTTPERVDTRPDNKWVSREMAHAKRLLKTVSIEEVLEMINWRLKNDDKNFWAKKLTSLGIVYSHLTDWKIEKDKIKQLSEPEVFDATGRKIE